MDRMGQIFTEKAFSCKGCQLGCVWLCRSDSTSRSQEWWNTFFLSENIPEKRQEHKLVESQGSKFYATMSHILLRINFWSYSGVSIMIKLCGELHQLNGIDCKRELSCCSVLPGAVHGMGIPSSYKPFKNLYLFINSFSLIFSCRQTGGQGYTDM